MSKIKVQHFGPIREGFTKDDGWMDINKVTVFIGNQGSGKSTVAKLISAFSWIEKVLVRGDRDLRYFKRKGNFKNQVLKYHRLDQYLKSNGEGQTYLAYEGKAFRIVFDKGQLDITPLDYEYYDLPQIMYVPAERNFISYVKSPKELKLSSESLQEFLNEFENAKSEIKGMIGLPINNTYLEYDKLNDTLNLRSENFNRLKLTDASSGFQSFIPLFLVSKYLSNTIHEKLKNKGFTMSSEELARFKKEVAEIVDNKSLTDEQRQAAISVLSARFNKTAFINIVEEPEQNLFPSSQWQMLQSLMAFNNVEGSSKLVLTTHSPYIISYLSILIQGFDLFRKINKAPYEYHNVLLLKLQKEMDQAALIEVDRVSVYEMNEQTGTIQKLSTEYGIPSDNNYLNNLLREGNVIFDKLLEIEQSLPA